jgi:hypothetical protein
MKSKFFKGLLAVVIACIASLFSVKEAGALYWAVSIVGVVLTYFGQNAILKPVSLFGQLDLTDIIKGAMMAAGTAISTYIASLADVGTVNWHNLLYSVGAATFAYLTKNILSNSDGVLGKER